MDCCETWECGHFSYDEKSNCLKWGDVKLCSLYMRLKTSKAPVAEVPCSVGLDTIADLRELLRDIKKWDIDRSGEHFMKTGQAMQMLLPGCLRKRIQKAVMSD